MNGQNQFLRHAYSHAYLITERFHPPRTPPHFCELRGEFPTFIGEFRSLHPAPCRFSQAFLEQNASEIYLSHSALILSSAYAFLPTKKRAEPAFTSAEACHASNSCSRGRFCAISYMSKKHIHPDAERTQRRRPMDVLLIRQAFLKLTERFSFRKATPFGQSAVLSLCGFIHPSPQGRH